MSATDLDNLEALARRATPGQEWIARYADHDCNECGGLVHAVVVETLEGLSTADSAYVGAVPPDVVLALIERVRRAEARGGG